MPQARAARVPRRRRVYRRRAYRPHPGRLGSLLGRLARLQDRCGRMLAERGRLLGQGATACPLLPPAVQADRPGRGPGDAV